MQLVQNLGGLLYNNEAIITTLYKAGGKLFGHRNSLDRTKAYIKALSNDAGIPASLLVTHQTGLGSNQATWVHPYVAIKMQLFKV